MSDLVRSVRQLKWMSVVLCAMTTVLFVLVAYLRFGR